MAALKYWQEVPLVWLLSPAVATGAGDSSHARALAVKSTRMDITVRYPCDYNPTSDGLESVCDGLMQAKRR